MKALILGATGQVGRALAASAPAGAQVIVLGRSACDIAHRGAAEKVISEAAPDLVINAAAYTAVDKAECEPEIAGRLNREAPGEIAAAAKAAGARMIHISTDFVFDGCSSRPYRPGDAPAPLSVYGRTKLDGERAVLAADPDALIVRTAWVYAADGANFLRTMLRLLGARERVTVVADQVGTPTSAASLAGALWRFGRIRAHGIHHYTDSGLASWYDFAVAIEEEARAVGLVDRPVEVRPITTADHPTPARRPAFAVLDKSDSWAALGEIPPHWRTELRAVLTEVKANG